jgi:hypothetical protein
MQQHAQLQQQSKVLVVGKLISYFPRIRETLLYQTGDCQRAGELHGLGQGGHCFMDIVDRIGMLSMVSTMSMQSMVSVVSMSVVP